MPLLLIPPIVYFAYQYGKSVRISFFDDFMIIRKGWVFPRRTVLSYYKGQACQFSNNLFIRRRHLAHLTLYTASGQVRVRYLPEATVRQAIDYALYQVENTRRSWM
jgi:putative membrane protein